ncbi:glycosyltransferase [Vibrio sp. Evd11]|uniref:glycosyltransferase n=1 Tax=Vibrio sp. Evd11 TaxID=1207404 RepID=UPI000EFC6882|nr:glycosyltransferase [Vibrio sp. Evd11]
MNSEIEYIQGSLLENKPCILIPAYNDKDGLKKTIDSICEKDINVLVVDDGSDEKLSLSEFGVVNFSLVIIRLKCNSGIVKALNVGLSTCKENKIRYVFRLDCCDIYVESRMEKQLNFLKENNFAMVGGNVEFFDENNRVLYKSNLPESCRDIKTKQVYRSCFIHPAILFDLNSLDFDVYYEKEYIHAEDYELFLRIVHSHDVGNIKDIVTRCLIRESGLSLSNRNAQILSVIKSQIKFFNYTKLLCYFGVVKSISLLVLPIKITNFVKTKLGLINR